jgi:hypothetical protein
MGREAHIHRTDSERILTEGEVVDYLLAQGTKQELSLPSAHHQNFVERYVQTTTRALVLCCTGNDS